MSLPVSGGGYYEIPLSYIQSILGIIVMTGVCKSVKTNRYISFVGSNTLIYFALHGKVYAVMEEVLRNKLPGFYTACLNNVAASSVLAVLITVTMSFMLIIPAMLINRWFPWVLGRKRK